jgi:hypothetical protein
MSLHATIYEGRKILRSTSENLMKTVEAIIEPTGEVRLIEPVVVASPRRALVTILEEAPTVNDAALLSEVALGEDWNRPEEDAAWEHLQPGRSS